MSRIAEEHDQASAKASTSANAPGITRSSPDAEGEDHNKYSASFSAATMYCLKMTRGEWRLISIDLLPNSLLPLDYTCVNLKLRSRQ